MTSPRPGAGIDLVLVWIGGTVGSGLRSIVALLDPPGLLPAGTLVVNLLGAFVLGALVPLLPGRARLLLGTGLLGGFTTYSALALETVELVRAGALGTAVAYALGTVTLGALAAGAGLALSRDRSS